MLTQSRLKEVLSYDPETGVFVWIRQLQGKGRLGEQAGSLGLGYRRISIDGERYLAHRLAWFYVTGEWPQFEVDHINGLRDDNRFANLRDITGIQNQQSVRPVPERNYTTGFVGVRKHRHGRFRANIKVNNKTISLGIFDTVQEASRAYWDAKRRLHPIAFRCISHLD